MGSHSFTQMVTDAWAGLSTALSTETLNETSTEWQLMSCVIN